MGLLQLAVDAWVGTAAFALARRSGVLLPPKLEFVHNETARNVLRRYLQAGESTVEKLESVQQAIRLRSASPRTPGATSSQALRKMSSGAEKLLGHGEQLLRKLRDKLR
ncbi:unnamed protein product [Polarella glacialis]|uniref:Uncharacterized protein n=1 Tax=Polarella glacialis TaxID=89957 RepID=A0A813JB83_POLGL|nr:unnamed protein product [Polarella glacialis]